MDFSQLDPKSSLIVTASRRQARFIREQYQQYQIAQGKQVWHSINVLPWSAFLDQCWVFYAQSQTENLPIRLTKAQSQFLWQQLVSGSEQTENLLNSQQAVNLSYDAWRMLNQWQIENFSYQDQDLDQEAFAEWQLKYRKQLSANNWLDYHQVGSLLASNFEQVMDFLPEKIAFYGFQQLNIQQTTIINDLKQNDRVFPLKSNRYGASRKLFSTDSQEQELIGAVRWAIERLKINKDQAIAILVPELEQVRTKLERIIQKELYPQDFLAGEKAQDWHDISISESLEKQPMVTAVLTWLKLFDSSLSKQELQTLLLTPYLYSSQEQHWQATRIELDVRKSNRGFYSLQVIQDLVQRHNLSFSWLEVLIEVKQELNELDKKFSFTEFVKLVISALEKLHWHGYQTLDTHEYQLQQHFLETLKNATSLSPAVSSLSNSMLNWSDGLVILNKYIHDQTYHQETPQAPIKIMGMLEAVAIEYDAIWFMSATDKVLPQKASLNPFLSKALQLKHNLPGSSQQREIDYAQSILSALLAKEELIFSYATHDGEQEQLPSPLLLDIAEKSPLKIASEQPDFINQWPIRQIETYQDDSGLPLTDSDYASGGTGILKTQAASPFDAYLRYRLGLYPLETDALGISFMDRGNIFHKVMQILWQHLKTQKVLLSYSDEELLKLIKQTINTVLNLEAKHLYILNNDGFRQTETERIERLVLAALEVDKERVAFEVIETEAKREIEVGGLRLHISIDRIDQLEDGSLIIIDYKTGTPTLASLFSDPIGEPQLLLYAVSEHKEETPVTGILFYQAHLKGNKYIGFTEASEMIKGVKALKDLADNPYSEQFVEAITQWRKMLNEIAKSFKTGEANLTDYSGNYGDHHSISRWLERDYSYLENLNLTKTGANND